MQAKGMHPKPGTSRGKLIDSLLGDYLEPTLIQPTFLYNYPRDISPLAKIMPGDPQVVERFEGYVGGMELCNAFTELNDPLDQEQRFLEMGRDYDEGRRGTPPDGRGLPARHVLRHAALRRFRHGRRPPGDAAHRSPQTIREVMLFPHLRGTE